MFSFEKRKHIGSNISRRKRIQTNICWCGVVDFTTKQMISQTRPETIYTLEKKTWKYRHTKNVSYIRKHISTINGKLYSYENYIATKTDYVATNN